MKRILWAIFMVLPFFCSAQQLQLRATAASNLYPGAGVSLKKGDEIVITNIYRTTERNKFESIYKCELLMPDKTTQTVTFSKGIANNLKFELNTIDDIWNEQVIKEVLWKTQKTGVDSDLRVDMESDALEYIHKYAVRFEDPYLENYIYGLISRISPSQLIDGRPGNINVLLEQNSVANAFIFSNGTLVLTTGLLANLHTEDELMAILAQQIAHYVLDHSLQNVQDEIKRQQRAEFWSALAVGVVAAGEGVAAAYTNYIPGGLTLAAAATASIVASKVIVRSGMNYSYDQEYEADRMAKILLNVERYNPDGLATAMNRCFNLMKRERSSQMFLKLDNYSYSDLLDRMKEAGTPYSEVSADFEKVVSFAVTNAAWCKFAEKRFSEALALCEQNIRNNVATSDDYLISAQCLLSLKRDASTEDKVMQMIGNAKSIDPDNMGVYKTEIIALLGLGHKDAGVAKLYEYRDNLRDIENSAVFELSRHEIKWANDMLVKLAGM